MAQVTASSIPASGRAQPKPTISLPERPSVAAESRGVRPDTFRYIVSHPTPYGRQQGHCATVRVRCYCGTVQEFDVTGGYTARELALDAVNSCECGNGRGR